MVKFLVERFVLLNGREVIFNGCVYIVDVRIINSGVVSFFLLTFFFMKYINV